MTNFSVFSFLETLDLLFSFCKFFFLKRNLKRQHVGFTIANLYALRTQFCEVSDLAPNIVHKNKNKPRSHLTVN